MVLLQDGSNLSGVYITNVGDERAVQREATLVGLTTGELVGFVVCWPDSSSLTSWAGRLVRNEEAEGPSHSLHTVWHLARQHVGGEPPHVTEIWETFLTYGSIFKKIADREGGTET
jgi:hypothetical protein